MPYHHFTREERYVISHLKLEGFSLRAIGRRLGRHYTSISREIMRNRPTYADDAVYWYYVSHPVALERTFTFRPHALTGGILVPAAQRRMVCSNGPQTVLNKSRDSAILSHD